MKDDETSLRLVGGVHDETPQAPGGADALQLPDKPASASLSKVDYLTENAHGEPNKRDIKLVERALREGWGQAITPQVKKELAQATIDQARKRLENDDHTGLLYVEMVRKMSVDDQAAVDSADKRDRLNEQSPTEIVGDRIYKVEEF